VLTRSGASRRVKRQANQRVLDESAFGSGLSMVKLCEKISFSTVAPK
jgi:hypothetical protein